MKLTKAEVSRTVARIFLFEGEDDYTTQKKVESWIEAFAKKYSPQGITRVTVSEDTADLAAQLRSVFTAADLFSSKRLVVIKSLLQQKAEIGQTLEEWLDNLSDDLFLLLWETAAVKRNLRLFKKLAALDKNGAAKIYSHSLPSGRELNRFIESYAKQQGGTIAPAAAEKLAIYLGRDLAERAKTAAGYQTRQVYNLWQAASEMDKLLAYKSRGQITESDVEKSVSVRLSDNVFLLTNALGRKDTRTALKYLEELIASEQREAEIKGKILQTLGALAYQFRSLLLLSLAKKISPSPVRMAEVLGWSGFRVQANLPLLANFSEAQIRATLAKLLELDKKLKSTGLPAKFLMSRFLMKV